MSYYWNRVIKNKFSSLIDKLINVRKKLYSIIYVIQYNDYIKEMVKNYFGEYMIYDYVKLGTMIDIFKCSLNYRNIIYTEHMMKKLNIDSDDKDTLLVSHSPLDEYDIIKLHACLNKANNILKECKNDVYEMNIDIHEVVPFYSKNLLNIRFERLSRKFEGILKLKNNELTEKILEILNNPSDNKKNILDKTIKNHIKKIVDGELLILKIRRCIFAKGAIPNPIKEEKAIINEINNYCN